MDQLQEISNFRSFRKSEKDAVFPLTASTDLIPQPGLAIAIPDQRSWNNVEKKKRVMSNIQIACYVMTLAIGVVLMIFYVNNSKDFVETYLRTNFMMMPMLGIVEPSSFYIRNEDLTRHVKREFFQLH